MRYLLLASLLWSFSFGLIKGHLGGLDPVAVGFSRLAIAAIVFIPAAARHKLARYTIVYALLLGALQFGLMYVLYIKAFTWLPAWMVAMFTVFTPIYVILANDLLVRRFSWRNFGSALLAVAGAAVVVIKGLPAGADWRGIVLLQGANLCFAVGQVFFIRLKKHAGGKEATLLAWMYMGAVLFTGLALILGSRAPFSGWHTSTFGVVSYLGLIPTALGFYLWNKGAGQTSPALLAGANNLKIPLAVIISWLVFRESADYGRVLIGLVMVVLALFVARPTVGSTTTPEHKKALM